MIAEPFIIFFLLRRVKRILKNTDLVGKYDKPITYLSYGIIILFASGFIFHIDYLTKWIWHAGLIGLIILVLLRTEFTPLKSLMYAVLPFALISLVIDIFKLIFEERYKQIDPYFEPAIVFSIIWMIAMIVVSNKQQKALRLEHEKALKEEEERKLIEARKMELEYLVKERTAELRHQKEQVENALSELKATQAQLIQSEKMASLGELTAGIAHEIQNPLNFVNNFAEVNSELLEEMKVEIEHGNFEQVKLIANDIKENEEKINHHGKRADAIVKGMLQHSRSSTGVKEATDINALVDEYLRLAYHGLRAKDKSFNATLKTQFDDTIGTINIIPQHMGRAILNLITNAFYAVNEKKKTIQHSGGGVSFEPTVSVSTQKKKTGKPDSCKVEIKVADNGNGIPKQIVDKIFQPFFTTKPTGQGTGLGLSLSYDIVKAHGGEIKVETKEGEGTAFIISLSLNHSGNKP